MPRLLHLSFVALLATSACSNASEPGPDSDDPTLTLHYLADTLRVIVGQNGYSDNVGNGGGLMLTLTDTLFALDMVTLPPGPFGTDVGLNYLSKTGGWTLTDSTVELVADDTVLFRTLTLHRQGPRLRARFVVRNVDDPRNSRELLVSLSPVALGGGRSVRMLADNSAARRGISR